MKKISETSGKRRYVQPGMEIIQISCGSPLLDGSGDGCDCEFGAVPTYGKDFNA